MRAVVLWFAAAGLVAAGTGCSRSSTPAGVPGAGPGFRVTWPGLPQEMPGVDGAYMATYVARTPGQVVLYSANVNDFGPAGAMSPRDLLAASTFAFQKDELSRKEIEHGPQKLPGLDIVGRVSGKISRKLVVAAGNRVYTVSVTATTEEALRTPEATAFFDSFTVDGK